MNDVYLAACANEKVKPNTYILRHLNQLVASDAAWAHVDLSRNHCGSGNGFAALLALLAAQSDRIESFDMSYTELDAHHVKQLCAVLKRATNLGEVRLHNCGLYLESVQTLLTLLRQNTSIIHLDVSSDETLPTPNTFPQSWSIRLEAQLDRNRNAKSQ
jgi:Ran GTPase-activating protein (RanGAP) involved in mRNA processing and transport